MELGNSVLVLSGGQVQVVPMSDQKEYRRQANFCEGMAQQATLPELKESWLRLAADWLGMISGEPATPEEQFDAAAQARGTRQEDSTSSH